MVADVIIKAFVLRKYISDYPHNIFDTTTKSSGKTLAVMWADSEANEIEK